MGSRLDPASFRLSSSGASCADQLCRSNQALLHCRPLRRLCFDRFQGRDQECEFRRSRPPRLVNYLEQFIRLAASGQSRVGLSYRLNVHVFPSVCLIPGADCRQSHKPFAPLLSRRMMSPPMDCCGKLLRLVFHRISARDPPVRFFLNSKTLNAPSLNTSCASMLQPCRRRLQTKPSGSLWSSFSPSIF